MKRVALRPIVLTDGTKIPRGMAVSVDARQLQSEAVYEEPGVFKPWRFYDLKDRDSTWQTKGQFAAASLDMPGFGFGRQACPGRAFAAQIIKLCIVNIILRYDIVLSPGEKPTAIVFRSFSIVDPKARVEVRKRDLKHDVERLLDGTLRD
jgi:cytochrome P450